MTTNGLLQIGLYFAVLLALVKPLGWHMARVFEGRSCGLDPALGWLERLTYRVAGPHATGEMSWQAYTKAMLAFNLLGFLAVYGLQRLQHLLPLNPEGLAAVTPDSSFNTAVSFATNTNWQGFIVLLASVVLIVGALTFFPALALGPIVEHLQLAQR